MIARMMLMRMMRSDYGITMVCESHPALTNRALGLATDASQLFDMW